MLKRVLKWTGITALVLILAVGVIAAIGSSMSLDRDYTHSNNTNALPLYTNPLATAATTPIVSPVIAATEIVRINANGFEFRARIAGNEAGRPTVILLHGFPVTSAMWTPLFLPLAIAGYRVIAFDQRGYSPGARPEQRSAYTIPNLVSDVMAVADAVAAEKFHLIGHDWGSAVGWNTVMQHSDRILSWTGISIAHPLAFADALENDPDQQSRSGYFALFTMPFVPEALFTFNGLFLLTDGAYAGMSLAQIAEYRAVFAEPRALTSALNWYRAMGDSLAVSPDMQADIAVPSLFIWGRNDPTAGSAAVDAQARYMKGPYRRLDLDGEHWLVTSHSREIVQAVLEHLEAN